MRKDASQDPLAREFNARRIGDPALMKSQWDSVSPLKHADRITAPLLIVHGDDRNEAIMRMRRALDEVRIEGVRTTVPFHKKMMFNSDFVDARLSTNFLEKNRP